MEEERKSRNEFLDVIRGLAILIVILGHALQGANHGIIGGPLHRFILTFQMEFLFAISGFAALYARRRAFIPDLKKHFIRLGRPYLAWVYMFYLAEAVLGIKSWTPSDAFGCILISGFWFLRQLLLIYIAFEIYAHLKPLAGIFLGLAALFAFALLPGEETLLHYAIWFVLGYIVHLVWRRALPGLSIPNPLSHRLSVWLSWCGKNSLALYAIHWNLFFVFLSLQLVNFHALVEKGLNFHVVATLVFALYTAGSIALILIMKKLPLLPQILLGESFTRR